MEQKERRRISAREEARARRHKKRKKTVFMGKIVILAVCVTVLVAASVLLYNLLPKSRVSKQLKAANAYMETEDFDGAIASCEEALKLDSTSVQAYRTMAGAYLTREDASSAEQILYQGWESTQDEGLLQYYCTVLLNEAVADINSGSCTMVTLEKCVEALEMDASVTDVYTLLEACYERLFSGESGQEGFFCNAGTDGTCGFQPYCEAMNRLLAVYEANPSEELKAVILKFASPDLSLIWLDTEHLQEYQELLQRTLQVGEDAGVSQLLSCTAKALEVLDDFEEAFQIFDSMDFTPIKAFMNSEKYVSIRDAFMQGTMEYWEGKTYIPVSREKIKLIQAESGWKFSFADYEECANLSDVISVWSVKQEDDGVQRLCISYEPAAADGVYYPHATYEFLYLYSNVEVSKGNYVPQMNYRFETRIATPEGTTTQLVGDWGGEHEWTTEF